MPGLLGAILLSTTLTTAGVREAACNIVEELGLSADATVMLTGVEGPPGEPAVDTFQRELERALVEAGLVLVDREALRKVLEEAALTGEPVEGDLMEIAAGFGASDLVMSTLSHSGEKLTAHTRVVSPVDGTLRASATAELTLEATDLPPAEESASLQVQLRRLADEVARGLDGLAGDRRYQTFAVLPFIESGDTTRNKQLGLLVSSEVSTLLLRDHGLLLVEREQIGQVIEELALEQSGLFDESTSLEVGRLAGAQALILGSVSEAGDRYLVNTKVVSTADGRVALAEQATLPAADLVALSSEAVVLRTRAGAVYRSLLLPGWGQIYNRQPIKGGILAGAEVAAASLGLAYQILGAQKQAEYERISRPREPEVFDRKVAKAERYYLVRNVALAVTAGIHLVNVIDALLSGKTYDTGAAGAGR